MELTGDTARKLDSAIWSRAFILRLDLRHNDHVIDYYRGFFERHQWLENGLCWIVVRPLNQATTVDDLLRQLNGGRDPEHRTMAYPTEEAIDEDLPVFFVFDNPDA